MYFYPIFNPRPPEGASLTRPPQGVIATPSGFPILNVLCPYVSYQCIAMGLFFPMISTIQDKYHPSSYDVYEIVGKISKEL